MTREDIATRAVFPDHAAAVAYLATVDDTMAAGLPSFDGPREYAGATTVFLGPLTVRAAYEETRGLARPHRQAHGVSGSVARAADLMRCSAAGTVPGLPPSQCGWSSGNDLDGTSCRPRPTIRNLLERLEPVRFGWNTATAPVLCAQGNHRAPWKEGPHAWILT